MKNIVMLAGAAALSLAGPAFAKPGHGHGNGNGNGHAYGYGRGDDGDDDERVGRVAGYNDDRDDDADDQDEGFRGQRFGYGAGGCPPGLAKKTPACIPPGQARKQAQLGQRYGNPYAAAPYGYANPYAPAPYGYANPYAAAPYGYANPYAAAPYQSYGSPYGYNANPQSMIVQQILGALIR